MSRTFRWFVAGLVTAMTFGLATWIAGALLLPSLMKSSADRWVVAAGLGAAMAAFAGLWGHWWATPENQTPPDEDSDRRGAPVGHSSAPGNVRNEIMGGTQHGPVVQGRDFFGPVLPGAGATPPEDPAPKEQG
jgi:hypothetical protein